MVVWLLEVAFDLPMYWTVHDVCRAISSELDFVNEMQNAQRAKQGFADTADDSVYIPLVYEELTTKRIMAMEWIDGVKVTDSDAIRAQGLSPDAVIQTTVDCFAQQIFLHGFVHGDPHPGNVFVRPRPGGRPGEHQVVVLDHGMYLSFSDKFLYDYCRLWKAMVLMERDVLEDICAGWGVKDFEFFASSQMMRPYQAQTTSAVHHQPTKEEILKMQVNAKARVRAMLTDTNLIPRELIILGRNLNIVRAINKRMHSPVNRAKVLAERAHMGLDRLQQMRSHHSQAADDRSARNDRGTMTLRARARDSATRWLFWVRMFALELFYRGTQFYRRWNIFFGRKGEGMEEVIDTQMQQSLRKLGLHLNLENGGLG